jgi:hypothetical protein
MILRKTTSKSGAKLMSKICPVICMVVAILAVACTPGAVTTSPTEKTPPPANQSYSDNVLGIAFDIQSDWAVVGSQGAEGHVIALDATGTSQAVLTFSVVGPFDTLDSTLGEVRRGAWGPFIRNVESVRLGELEALRLELAPGEERPPLVWLVVTPSDLAVGFIPRGDPTLAESVLATLRAVPLQEPWQAITPAPSTSDDVQGAAQALTSYSSLLHAGHYDEAAHHYGGDYDVLRGWNPDVNEDDYATLFERGCTANGLVCLPIGSVLHQHQVSPTEFRFVVEFINDDGTCFVLGPCCGATEEEMPPQTEFTLTVRKVDNSFLVQDLPVYVP